MSRESVSLALGAMNAFFGRDLDRMLHISDADLTFTLPRHEVEGGSDRGHDELRRAWEETDAVWQSLHADLEEVRDGGDCVVITGSGTNRTHDGHALNYRLAAFARASEGRLIELHGFAQDIAAPFALAGIQPNDDDDFARLRGAYAGFNAGDIDAVMRLLDQSIEWNPAEDFIDRTQLHGHDAVRKHLTGLHALWDDLQLDPITLIQVEDSMIVRFRQTATGGLSGIDVEAEGWHVWEIQDGLVVRQHTFREREDAFRTAGISVLA